MKHDSTKVDFFKIFFAFIAKDNYLSADEIALLSDYYNNTLPNLKDDVMTTYQEWKLTGRAEGRKEGREEGRQEGHQEGEVKKARLTVLRGRYRGAAIDFLADVSELPYKDVENLVKGYDKVYAKWLKREAIKSVEHLSAEEVRYLIDLFSKNQN